MFAWLRGWMQVATISADSSMNRGDSQAVQGRGVSWRRRVNLGLEGGTVLQLYCVCNGGGGAKWPDILGSCGPKTLNIKLAQVLEHPGVTVLTSFHL